MKDDACGVPSIDRDLLDLAPAHLDRNEVPRMFRHRLLSVRAFDTSGMMIDADVIDGESLESLIEHMLANKSVDNLHIHNAKLGCYTALVERG